MSTGPTAAPGWQFIQVPVSLPAILSFHDRGREAAHQVAGALAFWSSRINRFNASVYPNAVLIAAYCADRIGGRKSQVRPNTDNVQGCILEVGDHLDPVSYQALSDLGVELRRLERQDWLERQAAGSEAGLKLIEPRVPDVQRPSPRLSSEPTDRAPEISSSQGPPSSFSGQSDFGQLDAATAAMAGAANSLREAIRRRRAQAQATASIPNAAGPALEG